MKSQRRMSYQTRPKAPIPTGCRSEYLCKQSQLLSQKHVAYPARVPGSDLESRAKDLRSDEFGHGDLTARTVMFQSWSESREWDVGKEGVVLLMRMGLVSVVVESEKLV